MIVLSLDSAMNGCSACIYDEQGGVLAQKDINMTRGQAEALMPMVNDALSEAQITFKDIDLIAVTHGPGAFTGMRIGLATAKSIGMVTGVPVVGVSCFDAVLRTAVADKVHFSEYQQCVVVLETKRKDYYIQAYTPDCASKLGKPSVMLAEDIDELGRQKTIFIGDGVVRYESEAQGAIQKHFIEKPTPKTVAILGLEGYNQSPENMSIKPVYLRMPEIGKPKNPPRQLEQ